MEYTLRYGEELTLNCLMALRWMCSSPKSPMPGRPWRAELQAVLDSPIGCMPLSGRSAPKSVAIALPDETRPFPPGCCFPLLTRLSNAFPTLRGEDVAIVVGGGLHPCG